jgi:hypothetical protein
MLYRNKPTPPSANAKTHTTEESRSISQAGNGCGKSEITPAGLQLVELKCVYEDCEEAVVMCEIAKEAM